MEYMPNYLCDLHTHTTCSDGHDTPKELVDRASNIGMKIIAITDHDVIPDENIIENHKKINIVEYGRNKGLKLIRGIEISCDTNNEDVHIIGLGCDFTDVYFQSLEKTIQKSKVEGYQKLVDALRREGIDIKWEEILKATGNENSPELIQKKQIFEMMASKNYANSWKDAKRSVQENSALNIYREKPDPIDVINEIHRSRGIAILAHPYLITNHLQYKDKKLTRDEYIELLIEASLDGIEASYTYDKTSYKGSKRKEEIEIEIKEKYAEKVSIISGGSDYHGDYKKQITNPRELGECGISPEYFYGNKLLNNL